MRRKIIYESETMVPKEVEEILLKYQHRILDTHHEPDKTHLHIMNLRGELIRWFAFNQDDCGK